MFWMPESTEMIRRILERASDGAAVIGVADCVTIGFVSCL